MRGLVVVMFSGSGEDRDVRSAFNHGVNSYVIKPVDSQDLVKRIAAIHEYWFGHNHFPTKRDHLWQFEPPQS